MQTGTRFSDYEKARKEKRIDQMYQTAAQIAVKYGNAGNTERSYTFSQIKEFWTFDDDYPSPASLILTVRASTVKWYINQKVKVMDEIWNADFINGLALHGRLKFSKLRYPTFKWYHDSGIGEILKTSSFGGKVVMLKNKTSKWIQVPAFYLKHSENTLSFVAGLMAGAKIRRFKGKDYAKFSSRITNIKKIIEDLKIPIESSNKRYFTISPIWPALFTPKMPEVGRSKWLILDKPCNASTYAPILWRTYIDKKIKTRGLPYLKSERMVKYDFACEEGPMKRIEKLRVEMGLTELDNKIIEMVKIWGAKNNEKPNAESSNM